MRRKTALLESKGTQATECGAPPRGAIVCEPLGSRGSLLSSVAYRVETLPPPSTLWGAGTTEGGGGGNFSTRNF
jgi:hypothetical protein